MRSSLLTLIVLGCILCSSPASGARSGEPRKGKLPTPLPEVLSHMNDAAKHLKTLSANLEYTKFTALVSDKSTEIGHLFYRKGKNQEIRIEFQEPDSRVILFKKNKAEIYQPKINQIEEFNLEQKSGLIEEFLLLGFGSETGELQKSYSLKLLKEEELDGDTTAVIELTPRKENVAAQLTKIHMWISEESWLPTQQQFFEPSGDYLIARYKAVKVNRPLSSSTFEIHPAENAKRIKMN